jgi:hypothetical protein
MSGQCSTRAGHVVLDLAVGDSLPADNARLVHAAPHTGSPSKIHKTPLANPAITKSAMDGFSDDPSTTQDPGGERASKTGSHEGDSPSAARSDSRRYGILTLVPSPLFVIVKVPAAVSAE